MAVPHRTNSKSVIPNATAAFSDCSFRTSDLDRKIGLRHDLRGHPVISFPTTGIREKARGDRVVGLTRFRLLQEQSGSPGFSSAIAPRALDVLQEPSGRAKRSFSILFAADGGVSAGISFETWRRLRF